MLMQVGSQHLKQVQHEAAPVAQRSATQLLPRCQWLWGCDQAVSLFSPHSKGTPSECLMQ